MMQQDKLRIKDNDKGVTLVELLVVIAIMGILVGVGLVAFGLLDTGRCKESYNDFESYVSKLRSKTMSVVAEEWNVSLTKKDGEYNLELIQKQKDSEGNITTQVVESTTFSGKIKVTYDDVEVTQLIITFKPSTGEVKSLSIDGVLQSVETQSKSKMFSVISGNHDIGFKIYYNTGKLQIE